VAQSAVTRNPARKAKSRPVPRRSPRRSAPPASAPRHAPRPAAAAAVKVERVFSWRPVRGAAYYEVLLQQGATTIYEARTSKRTASNALSQCASSSGQGGTTRSCDPRCPTMPGSSSAPRSWTGSSRSDTGLLKGCVARSAPGWYRPSSALRQVDPIEVVIAPREPEPDFDREWAVPGSNQRPPACKAGALPTELTALGPRVPHAAGSQTTAQVRSTRLDTRRRRSRHVRTRLTAASSEDSTRTKSSWPRRGGTSFGSAPSGIRTRATALKGP
jgi:hypothetical protein